MDARQLVHGGTSGLLAAPEEFGIEQTVLNLVLWLKLLVETLGAIIIGVGIAAAAYVFVRALVTHRHQSYNRIRLTFARFLALALEFQVAADVLSTAVAPTWDQIGKLAAIAAIRTALNYFLTREMKEEQEGIAGDPGHGNERRDARRPTTAPVVGDVMGRP
jgi:uncharacterized membrane protein